MSQFIYKVYFRKINLIKKIKLKDKIFLLFLFFFVSKQGVGPCGVESF